MNLISLACTKRTRNVNTMQNRISIFSFFSGIGILDLAFERNGYNIVFVNEYDSFFLESYQYARTQMNQRDPLLGYGSEHIGDKGQYHIFIDTVLCLAERSARDFCVL